MTLSPSRSMFWKLFLPVGTVLVLSAAAAAIFLPAIVQRNAEHDAIAAGQDTVRQFKVLRKYYTENVIAKILAKTNLSVSPDHRNDPNAVPLPATMIHDLSALIQVSGTTLKLYSPYPFPNRKDRVLDKFGQDAWTYFQTNPDRTFSRTESLGAQTVVRVAIADRMADQACVNCHNSVKGSPKTDWKLNDVRGVLEVDSSRQLASGQKIVNQVLAMLGLAMTLLAAFLWFFYRHNIARPLDFALNTARALTADSADKIAAVEAIASGNLEQDFAIARVPTIDPKEVSDDEIGVLLKSVVGMSEVQVVFDQALRKMTASLRHGRAGEAVRDWLKSGQNELNALMRGEHETAQLADKVLCYLAERLGAGVGALYLFDESTNELYRVASYALRGPVTPAQRFRLGEGLIGQAARERKTICLTAVPADYLTIGSALGDAAPRNVMAVPLLHADGLIGALEIGSFKIFDAAQSEFLEQAREGIAIGFAVNLSRARTHALLEQTQQQTEELRVQQEELQQSNEELEERAEILERQREQIRAKNEEMERASAEIQRKAAELEKANTYKSEFLANMSHELRTPLNSMLILSGLLKENKDQNLNEKQVEYAGIINGAGTDLLNLINDILDLSKVEAGKIELHYEDVPVQDIYVPLETLFRSLAEQKQLAFSIDLDADMPREVHIDLLRTQQVLKNLISNALKFTQRGAVSLRIHVVPPRLGLPTDSNAESLVNPLTVSALAFVVTDTGIGIARDKESLVFEAFKQADGGISRMYGGTGLGLSISRQLALRMGGELRMRSVEGEGSVFTLFLPLHGPVAQIAPANPIDTTTHVVAPIRRTVPAAASPVDQNAAGAWSRAADALPAAVVPDDRAGLRPGDKCILIVEDDLIFAQILADFVREHKFGAVVAVDGESSIVLASHYLPSAIILDVMLPHIDGWGVMRCLKDNPRTRHIPVHFITGEEDRRKALEMGAVGFVTKPISIEQLATVVHTIEDSLAKSVKNLLIVEDNPDEAKSLFALLTEKDVHIEIADSGAKAIALLAAEQFDCMVLDLGLSDMSGFDLLAHVQEMDVARRVPVIIHSGRDLTREEERELRRYAETIIVKGAKSPERLLNEVTLFLHLVESNLEPAKQRMIRASLDKEAMLEDVKVLLVDDDMRNIYALTSLLCEKNMTVIEAENGREALAKLAEHPDINLVLMDIMMPEMDGYTAMREIRKDARFQKLPIIAMTAKAMKGDQQKCLDAGASDYITKPIDVPKLMSLLRVWTFRQK